jgi:hypothetical protein
MQETSVKAGCACRLSSRYIRPKRRLTFNGLHGVISQKIKKTLHINDELGRIWKEAAMA